MESQANGAITSTRATVDHARDMSYRAIEAFVLRHDLPNTQVGLRLLAGEDSYSGQALVTTPFGVEAVFALDIPKAHEWGRVRRVVDLSAGTEVHVPKESGWISKRREMQIAKLDKLFICEVAVTSDRSLITLRKGPRSGSGYQLEVSTENSPRATLRLLGEDGNPTADPMLELDGEDAVHALRLWNRVIESTRDLATRRQSMTSATFDGKPLNEVDEPQSVCVRMVNVLSPVVQEIAHRSGAPGELVLRRDLGGNRREEIYITKAELHEKVLSLPPRLRGVFDPFELTEGPRSPRAPAPSEPILIDGADYEVDTEEEPTRDRR
jgi:hypothetical protein